MSTEDAARVIARRWQGMKVGSVGVGIAAVGFGLTWFLGYRPGLFLFFVGLVVGAAGGVIHVRQMFRESRLRQSDLYPRTSQPWEK
jgi:hypothetical protein